MNTRGLICGCLVVFAAGCGKKAGPDLPLVPVSGQVTLDGRPLTGATIAFASDLAQVTGHYGSGAVTDEEGRYQLQTGKKLGALEGTYTVTISRAAGPSGGAMPSADGNDLEQLRRQGLIVESMPACYSNPQQSQLKAVVAPGNKDGHRVDFELRGG
jgi:hypothetical protein